MSAAVKIVCYEPGAAHVFDRESGKKIGYVLQDNWNRWTPYRDGRPVGPVYRYRKEAAASLWVRTG